MLFSTVQFFVFLAIVLALFWLAPQAWRRYLLLTASYFFYWSWNPKFVPLLASLTAIDYFAAMWIERTATPSARRAALCISLAANLGFLGFFKYYNFVASNIGWLMGQPDRFLLDIVLPLGISFHTFQSISYVVDVYRREQKAIRNLTDYALFISFFPQLVAGPIVRAHEFFRDLYNWRPPDAVEVRRGVLLIVLGLVKKVALADQFSLVSDAYFTNVTAHPGMLAAWTGTAAFGLQVYFDFSGYSDMAIGMALLFGFRFPENFRRPFLATSITELWRRWHMTLTRWLRDYVYVPLCLKRRGTVRIYGSLMLTMLICGLWHGAAWHYMVWGGTQGVLLAMERAFRIKPVVFGRRPVSYAVRCALTFLIWTACAAMFRAPDFSAAWFTWSQMFHGAWGGSMMSLAHIELAIIALLLAILEEWKQWFEGAVGSSQWAYAAALTLMFLTLELFSVTEVSIPFVYFQF
ncbi:MAG TPA: MBOAT family O-acyltransferase [Bryobacteraceae bacterium]|nr:MBOAT family O-acyltransferase [Bryobacteraceae bacterium]